MTDAKPLSLREKRRLETRQLLLTSAIDLISDRGFQSTAIEDITERAGTSRATFYAYFESKDALLAAVLEQMWLEVEDIYARFGALTDWSPRVIAAWLTDFVEAWRLTAARNRAATDAAQPSATADAAERYRRIVETVRTQRPLWSHFTEREANARAGMLVAMLQQVLTDHFYFDHPDLEASRPASSISSDEMLVEHLTSAVRDLLRAET